MRELQRSSIDATQQQQELRLDDEFLQELVRELDSEEIVGMMLGGSYARGEGTLYSDVDLACFWREGLRPPPKRFLYRRDKLISVKMTTVSEIRETLKRPSSLLFSGAKRRILLDKDGSVARLLAEIEAFRWEDLQEVVNANISLWMMLKAEDVQKILREFQQANAPGLALVIPRLVEEMTLLTALCHRTLITNDSTYYQQVEVAAGLESAWTRAHCIAAGLEAGPSGIAPLWARGIAVLHLYRETLIYAGPVMQADHRAIAEQVLRVVRTAAERLPFTVEERRWLILGIEQ